MPPAFLVFIFPFFLRGQHCDVALVVHQLLALRAQKPPIEDGGGAVLRLAGVHHGVVKGAEGISPGPDGIVVGLHPVHLQQLQSVSHVHVLGVVVDGIADGGGRAVKGADRLDESLHGADEILGIGGLHHLQIPHDLFFHDGLAAAALIALEGDDLPVLPTHLTPVGDLSGVDLLDLLHGEAVHRIVGVDHKDQRLGGDGLLGPLQSLLVPLGIGGLAGLGHHQKVGLPRHQGIIGPRRFGEMDEVSHVLPALPQQHRGDGLA